MSDLIDRQAAIDALDEIRHALWEIDIPSPTVPEYVEHHKQVQSVWKLLDKKQKELYILPSAQLIQCKECVYGNKMKDTIRCELMDYLPVERDHFCSWAERIIDG